MKTLKMIFVIVFMVPAAFAGQSFTLQGRLLNSAGSAVTSSSVQFRIQVKSPGAEDCLLYQETQTVDLSQTQGNFALTIGQGTRAASAVDGGNSLNSIFSNSSAISLTSATTPCGSGATSYTPVSSDTRKLELTFDDGSGWDTVPSIPLTWVPQAMHAQNSDKLGDVSSTQFLRVASGTTPAAISGANYTQLTTLLAGTNTTYLQTANVSAARTTLGLGTTATLNTGTGASDITVNSGVPSCTSTQKLQMSSSAPFSWSCVADSSGSDSTKLPLAGGTMTGAILSADGTAAAPSLAFSTGNTGIYLGSSSSLGFSTAGSERLRVTSAGNVGIAEATPLGKLQVAGKTNLGPGTFNNTGAGHGTALNLSGSADLQNNNLYMNYQGSGNYYLNASTLSLGYNGVALIQTAGGKLTLQPVSQSGQTQDVILNPTAGNVGIGTAAPASKLHIAADNTSSTAYGVLSLGAGYFDGSTAGKFTGNAAGTELAVNAASGFTGSLMDLQTNGTSRFRVAYNGLVESGPLYATSLQSSSGNFGTSAANTAITIQSRDFSTATTGISMITGTVTNSSGTFIPVAIKPIYNQTSTAAATDFLINRTQTAVGSGAQLLLDAQVGGATQFNVTSVGNGYFAGNVGVGIASPTANLEVKDKFAVQSSSFSYRFTIDPNNGAGPQLQLGHSSDASAYFRIGAFGGINNFDTKNRDFKLYSDGDNNGFYFKQSNGFVGVGTTSPSTRLHVVGASSATVATFSDGTATCSITPAIAGNITCSSDQRLKRDIASVSDLWSLDKILALNTVTYRWKNSDPVHTGFIAQEIEKILPEFVSEDSRGYKQVSYVGLIPLITGAIKAVNDKLESLKNLLASKAEQSEVEVLKKQIESIRNENLQMKSYLCGKDPSTPFCQQN